MDSSKRVIVLIAFLLLAFVCYGIGMYGEALLFIAVGGLFECPFWMHLFRPRVKK